LSSLIMLAQWFNRNGIGQLLAPDENAAKQAAPVDDEARGTFWQIVAPDPNFEPPKAPPPMAFMRAPSGSGQVLCMHCNQWTTVGETTHHRTTPGSRVVPETPTSDTRYTPSSACKPRDSTSESDLIENLVLLAAKATATSMSSPPQLHEARDKVFRLCASQKAINEKLAKRLRNVLTKDPTLIHARATHLGQLVPDGYTPIMACAYADHVVAAEIVLAISPNAAHLDRDLQGRTALHIAAEMGHMNMVNLLLPKYQVVHQGIKSPAPVDLLGRTPLGRAVTSPNPTARKRQKQLESALFSPGDLSVFGVAKPESERTAKHESLKIAYGIADMPGMRVTMEDAVCTSMWKTANGKPYCLLGVCDGHGDRGKVSDFVATHAPSVLQSHMTEEDSPDWDAIWKTTCLELDDKLKLEKIQGGSTAVFALITEDLIVVANVGDSRAILIQSSPNSSSTGLEEKMEHMAVSESTAGEAAPSLNEEEGYPAAIDEDQPQQATPDTKEPEAKGPIVIAMSDDHKPELEEERARIENAGMKVVPITFQENGKDVTIHKVAKTDSEMLAVSRSFGDFEYKLNTTLPPDEQAVTAVADVRVHSRDAQSDLYLVLACDGVWDVMDNETVKDYVLNQVQVRADISDTVLPEVGDSLLRESLNLGSRDNMTTVLVALSKESDKIRPVIQGKALDFGFFSPRK
jgi:serine/threonine protein phosphatase PrpC